MPMPMVTLQSALAHAQPQGPGPGQAQARAGPGVRRSNSAIKDAQPQAIRKSRIFTYFTVTVAVHSLSADFHNLTFSTFTKMKKTFTINFPSGSFFYLTHA